MAINDPLIGMSISDLPPIQDTFTFPTPNDSDRLIGKDISELPLLDTQQVSALPINKESEESTVLGEVGKGISAGHQQIRGMGYGLAGLLGQVTGLEGIKQYAKEGLQDVQERTPAPAVPSYKDVKDIPTAAKYLAYGTASNLENMLLSIIGGAAGYAGGRIAAGALAKKAGRELTEEAIKIATKRGALGGAFTSSLGMEAGSISGDQLTETGQVSPGRAVVGGSLAAILDVVPEWYLAKRLGIFGDEVGKAEKNIIKRVLKIGGQQFAMEAPTEAAQSFIERKAVPGKSVSNKEAWDEYIDSFILGGMTGAVAGGAGGVFANTGRKEEAVPVTETEQKTTEQQKVETQPDIFAGLNLGQEQDTTIKNKISRLNDIAKLESEQAPKYTNEIHPDNTQVGDIIHQRLEENSKETPKKLEVTDIKDGSIIAREIIPEDAGKKLTFNDIVRSVSKQEAQKKQNKQPTVLSRYGISAQDMLKEAFNKASDIINSGRTEQELSVYLRNSYPELPTDDIVKSVIGQRTTEQQKYGEPVKINPELYGHKSSKERSTITENPQFKVDAIKAHNPKTIDDVLNIFIDAKNRGLDISDAWNRIGTEDAINKYLRMVTPKEQRDMVMPKKIEQKPPSDEEAIIDRITKHIINSRVPFSKTEDIEGGKTPEFLRGKDVTANDPNELNDKLEDIRSKAKFKGRKSEFIIAQKPDNTYGIARLVQARKESIATEKGKTEDQIKQSAINATINLLGNTEEAKIKAETYFNQALNNANKRSIPYSGEVKDLHPAFILADKAREYADKHNSIDELKDVVSKWIKYKKVGTIKNPKAFQGNITQKKLDRLINAVSDPMYRDLVYMASLDTGIADLKAFVSGKKTSADIIQEGKIKEKQIAKEKKEKSQDGTQLAYSIQRSGVKTVIAKRFGIDKKQVKGGTVKEIGSRYIGKVQKDGKTLTEVEFKRISGKQFAFAMQKAEEVTGKPIGKQTTIATPAEIKTEMESGEKKEKKVKSKTKRVLPESAKKGLEEHRKLVARAKELKINAKGTSEALRKAIAVKEAKLAPKQTTKDTSVKKEVPSRQSSQAVSEAKPAKLEVPAEFPGSEWKQVTTKQIKTEEDKLKITKNVVPHFEVGKEHKGQLVISRKFHNGYLYVLFGKAKEKVVEKVVPKPTPKNLAIDEMMKIAKEEYPDLHEPTAREFLLNTTWPNAEMFRRILKSVEYKKGLFEKQEPTEKKVHEPRSVDYIVKKYIVKVTDKSGKVKTKLTAKEEAQVTAIVDEFEQGGSFQSRRNIEQFMAKYNLKSQEMLDAFEKEWNRTHKSGEKFQTPKAVADMALDQLIEDQRRDLESGMVYKDEDVIDIDNNDPLLRRGKLIGSYIYQSKKPATFNEFKLYMHEYAKAVWSKLKHFITRIWNTIIERPKTVSISGVKTDSVMLSRMTVRLTDQELYHKLATQAEKDAKNMSKADPKRAWFKNFRTSKLVRTDQVSGEGIIRFEAVLQHYKFEPGVRKPLSLSESDIKRIRAWKVQNDLLFGKAIKEDLQLSTLRNVLMNPTFATRRVESGLKPLYTKDEVDDILWNSMSVYHYRTKLLRAAINSLKNSPERYAQTDLSANWTIRKESTNPIYFMRRVTSTVRSEILNNDSGTIEGKRNPFTDEVTKLYNTPNGQIRTFLSRNGEFIVLSQDDVLNNNENKRTLINIDNIEAKVAREALRLKPGIENNYFDKLVMLRTGVKGTHTENIRITKEELLSKIPGAEITELENGAFNVKVGKFSFSFDQASRVNYNGESVKGAWNVGDFSNSLMAVSNVGSQKDVNQSVYHEVFHMVSDVFLSKSEQTQLLSIYKQESDTDDRAGWERAADDFMERSTDSTLFTKIMNGARQILYAIKSMLFNIDPLITRDKLFAQIKSGQIYNRELQLSPVAKPQWASKTNNNITDPNEQIKQDKADLLFEQNNPMNIMFRKMNSRDAEKEVLHNPSYWQSVIDIFKSPKYEAEAIAQGYISAHEMGTFERWISNPTFQGLAKVVDKDGNRIPKYKGFHAITDAQSKREEENDLLNYRYKAEQTIDFQKMNDKMALTLDPIIEWSTINKHYLTESELRNQDFIKKIHTDTKSGITNNVLHDTAIKGYLQISDYIKKTLKPMIIKQIETMLLKPYMVSGNLSGKELIYLKQLYSKLLGGSKPTSLSIKDSDGNVQEVELKDLFKEYKNLKKAFNNLSKQLTGLKRLRNEFWGLEGYFPLRRPVGSHYVAVIKYSPETTESGEPVYDSTGKQKQRREVVWSTSAQNAGHMERVRQYVESDIKNTYDMRDTDTQKFKVVYGRSHTLQDSSYFMVGDLNTERILDNAISELQAKGEIDIDMAGKLSDQILQSVSDTMRARGAAASGISRNVLKWERSPVTQGYIRTNMRDVINGYVSGFHGMQTKIQFSLEALQILKDIKDRGDQPQMYADLSAYAKEMLRNADKMDRVIGKLKSFAFKFYLWAKMSAVVLQFTQSFTTSIPVLGAEMRALGMSNKFKASRYVFQAMKDLGFRDWMKRGKLKDESEQRIQDYLHLHGITLPQFSRDLEIYKLQGGERFSRQLFEILAQSFSDIETYNRKVAALAMQRMLTDAQKQGKIKLSEEDMYGKIKDYINQTQYWFGKGSAPAVARIEGPTGKLANMAYTFMRFPHNYLLNMVYATQLYGGVGGSIMIAKSMAILIALAGVPALPWLDDFLEIAERHYGIPLRKLAKDAVKKSFGSTTKKFYDAGILGFICGDMAQSMRPLRVPGLSGIDETIGGVYYGIGKKVIDGLQAFGEGDVLKGMVKISPSAIEAQAKAYMAYKRGYRTASNQTIYDEQGKPLTITVGEYTQTVLGFKPYRYSNIMEERRQLQNIEAAYKSKRDKLHRQSRIAKSNSEKLEVYNNMAKYNMNIPKELRGVIPFIKPTVDIPKPKWLRFEQE